MADTQIERLSSIGVKVTIGTHQLLGAISCGDFGGAPNMIDASCLLDTMDQQVPGRKQQGSWDVQYLYNDKDGNGDFGAMQTLAASKAVTTVQVEMPNGAKFSNSGIVSNYANGVEDSSTLKATVSVAIQGGDWTYTAPTNG